MRIHYDPYNLDSNEALRFWNEVREKTELPKEGEREVSDEEVMAEYDQRYFRQVKQNPGSWPLDSYRVYTAGCLYTMSENTAQLLRRLGRAGKVASYDVPIGVPSSARVAQEHGA
jgi:hypothetical protein